MGGEAYVNQELIENKLHAQMHGINLLTICTNTIVGYVNNAEYGHVYAFRQSNNASLQRASTSKQYSYSKNNPHMKRNNCFAITTTLEVSVIKDNVHKHALEYCLHNLHIVDSSS